MRAIPRWGNQNFGSKYLRQEPIMMNAPEKMKTGAEQEERAEEGNRMEKIKERLAEKSNFGSDKSGVDINVENLKEAGTVMIRGSDGIIQGDNDFVVDEINDTNDVLLVIDSKRRRKDNIVPNSNEDIVMGFVSDGLSKNEFGAGSGFQARQKP